MHERPSDLSRTHRARATAIAALATFSFVALSGCAASTTPEPAPAPTPSLTQEQQDDAAFQDVFTRYVAIDLGAETKDELMPILTGSALQGEIDALEYSAEHSQKVTGKVTSSGFRVTDRGSDTEGKQYMTAQACLDLSGTRTLSSDGSDVTPVRDQRLAVQMKAVRVDDGSWRISDSVRNEETHACD